MFFVFQAEDGIRVLVRSRVLGDVYKRQVKVTAGAAGPAAAASGSRIAAMRASGIRTRVRLILSLIHI